MAAIPSTPAAAATPSPPPHIHTPPTPRLGFADSWEPFSPRKSSRIAAAAAKATSSASSSVRDRTPSPSASASTRRAVRNLRSPHPTQLPRKQADTAVPVNVALTPEQTPRKNKTTMPPTSSSHILSPGSARRTGKKTAADAALFGDSSSTRMGVGMLPTPAKTPSKTYHAASQNESNIRAIARNLFHMVDTADSVDDQTGDAGNDVDAVMASPSRTPSRKPKKYTGISLESFAVVEEDEPIAIYTDSQDRVPEADDSAENPFFGDHSTSVPSSAAAPSARRRSRRGHVSIPGEGKQSVEEATRREDGLVYVFRGKKIFRKFEEAAADQQEDILEGADAGRRLTRSAIKPRLLFPRDNSAAPSMPTDDDAEDDEEAVTDIEDHNMEEPEANKASEAHEDDEALSVSTPTNRVDDAVPSTPPKAPQFAPASPPVTGRKTRSSRPATRSTPAATGAPKKRSPFDGWRQTKSSTATGHKRPVGELDVGVSSAGAKRSRA